MKIKIFEEFVENESMITENIEKVINQVKAHSTPWIFETIHIGLLFEAFALTYKEDYNNDNQSLLYSGYMCPDSIIGSVPIFWSDDFDTKQFAKDIYIMLLQDFERQLEFYEIVNYKFDSRYHLNLDERKKTLCAE